MPKNRRLKKMADKEKDVKGLIDDATEETEKELSNNKGDD